jgi:hypothetical protein
MFSLLLCWWLPLLYLYQLTGFQNSVEQDPRRLDSKATTKQGEREKK